jgi:ceramide glucosyltransferase
MDSGIEENLETFFKLDYPEYELLFSVADARDPALLAVTRLMKKFPDVRARLIVGEAAAGINPKVNNMIYSYEQTRYDVVLISDSNVRVRSDYLRRTVAHLDDDVGMVTAVVAGCSPLGIGGYLESIYLNTFYARAMRITETFGRPCVVGKSMLFRKSTAARFGGLTTLGRYLAEDFVAGEAMRALGQRVVIMADPIEQHIGKYSLSEFWARHIRWGRIRKAQAPLAYLFEPLLNSMVSGLIGAWAMTKLFGVPYATFLAVHLSVWSTCDYLQIRVLEPKLNPRIPIAWFVREFVGLILWANIGLGNTVKWRGQKLALRPGGLLDASS